MKRSVQEAVTLASLIAKGESSSEEVVRDFLTVIVDQEERVKAWAFLNPELALEQAKAADRHQKSGASLGALHGVPVGIKDVFDTHDMPTENGTPLCAGRAPSQDAEVVKRLRQAGAVILGKTVTTELAVYTPGKTHNPHDPKHTPGGSSSGSAAAVAAHMIPLSVGTQTNGSVIRPASYCGVYGFKPSHGLIPRTGVLLQSRTLDQIGVFANSLNDVLLMAKVLMGFDDIDTDVLPSVSKGVFPDEACKPSQPLKIAFVKTPIWDQLNPSAKTAFESLFAQCADFGEAVALPTDFEEAHAIQKIIMEADMAKCYEDFYNTGKSQISPMLCQMIERGRTYKATDYSGAQNKAQVLKHQLDHLLQTYDAILTPATQGAAPLMTSGTGSPMFCTIWSLCGVPALSLPILQEGHLPMGAQLIGRKGFDGALLRSARLFLEKAKK